MSAPGPAADQRPERPDGFHIRAASFHPVRAGYTRQDRPPRYEYRLTEAGLDLIPVLMALTAWGDRWAAPDAGPPIRFRHRCGEIVSPVVACPACGGTFGLDTVTPLPGPGGRAVPRHRARWRPGRVSAAAPHAVSWFWAVRAPGVRSVLTVVVMDMVIATGPDVELFTEGDEVYYAGSIARLGSNAGLQLVDFRPSRPAASSYAEVLNVRGAVVAIDDPQGLDLLPLKPKSIREFMFTRPLYQPESCYQHELLDEVGRLVDAGILRTTLTTRLSPLDAATLRRAHRQVESSTTMGKVVVLQPE